MTLILTVGKGPPGGAPEGSSKTIDSRGATLGRNPTNTWALPGVDGDGLSRKHCRIVCEDNAYSAVDENSTYGLFINDARLPRGGRARLTDGDRLRLGEYELHVRLEAPIVAAKNTVPNEPNPFSTISPFEWPASEPAKAIPESFASPHLPMRDDLPPEKEMFRTPEIRGGLIPEDWLNAAAGSAPLEPAVAVRGETTRADALAAFLAGAGLDRTRLSGADPDACLRAAGEAYRIAVEGIREILASRTQLKDEFRIEKTRIGASGNNPLKFSASTDEALLAMIAASRPGFTSAPAAMREALQDIKGHEMALIAAIQVALTRLLEQIDPEKLKARLEKRSLLDGLVPGARKARTWEIYETMHAEIARELAEDFQGTFGKAFADAYEKSIRRR
jgi:type VI secretion system protein